MRCLVISLSKLFKRNIKYIQYGRSGSILITRNVKIAKILQSQGWTLYENQKMFRMNPPSITLVDITDVEKINQYNNPVFNFVLYKYLKKKIDKNKLYDYIDSVIYKHKLVFKDFTYHISFSPILNFVIKIEGSDNRINKLQMFIIDSVLEDNAFKLIYKEYLSNMDNFNILKISPISERNIQVYNKLCLTHGINKKFNYGDLTYVTHNDHINFNDFDYVIFVLKGCFKFIHYFDISSYLDKIMFWEIHIDKSKGFDKIYNMELLKNKKILVIDSVYSGATVKYIKNLLNAITHDVQVLGVFPKSEKVFNLCDFVLLGNKIFSRIELENYDIEDNYFVMFGDRANEKRYSS